jgi:hypothetical protein
LPRPAAGWKMRASAIAAGSRGASGDSARSMSAGPEDRRIEVPKFLIEVSHDSDAVECSRAVHILLTTGSHFVTHAEWGCLDGVHSAWMIIEVDSKAEALGIVPPAFRARSRVVGLNRFSLPKIEAFLREHPRREGASGG